MDSGSAGPSLEPLEPQRAHHRQFADAALQAIARCAGVQLISVENLAVLHPLRAGKPMVLSCPLTQRIGRDLIAPLFTPVCFKPGDRPAAGLYQTAAGARVD